MLGQSFCTQTFPRTNPQKTKHPPLPVFLFQLVTECRGQHLNIFLDSQCSFTVMTIEVNFPIKFQFFSLTNFKESVHQLTHDAGDDGPLLDGRRFLKSIGVDPSQQGLTQVHVIKRVADIVIVALETTISSSDQHEQITQTTSIQPNLST